MEGPSTTMNAEARVRLHELVYARASLLEAESYARRLRTERYDDVVRGSLITSLAVAYVRPFMRTNSPDDTKKPHLEAALAEKIDAPTHKNLVKIRHEVCAHKDLSSGGVNIPVIRVAPPGGIDIHTLRVIEMAPEECVQVEKLCLALAGEIERMVGELLRTVREPLPAAGTYTISHGTGPWLVPLTEKTLDRANLERDGSANPSPPGRRS